jgi:ion channel-forming bestrophin family protein
MIEYDGRAWLPLLFRIRGSVIPRLIPRMVFAACVGVVAVLLHEREKFKLPTLAHTLVGVALGLLLVFRTNASYDRYWEGRRLLGSMVNRTRDLARQVASYISDPAARTELGNLIRAFYWAAAQTLRRKDDLEVLRPLLSAAQLDALAGAKMRGPIVTAWISNRLRDEVAAGRLTEQRLQLCDQNLSSFNDSLGGAERILNTPIPFAYAQHIKIFVVLFCFSVPFAMVDIMYWATPFASALLALALFGIDEIGVEIEDPFGDDANDLPLDKIGAGIDRAVTEILAATTPA